MIHNIKILRSFADAVLSGDKNFEIRENDRGYQKGDTVNFTVIDKNGACMNSHKLNTEFFEITYVLSGWGIKDGYVVFGIKRIEDECSNCHDDVFQKTEWQFCPNCGASMISSNSKIEKSNSEICPCIECCKIDNSELCRKGCSEYKKWKEGGADNEVQI